MASYAPLFAKKDHTQWKTDMIFFDNNSVSLTPNYYVQKMFSTNRGDVYFPNIITYESRDSTLASSCLKNSTSGEIILKMVNTGIRVKKMKVNLSSFKKIMPDAVQTIILGNGDEENTLDKPNSISPSTSIVKVTNAFDFTAPAMSLTIIRIKTPMQK